MNSRNLLNEILSSLEKIRAEKPLVHQITNYVSARDQANITLGIGAIPVMAEHPDELKEVLPKARALLLNTGTMTNQRNHLYLMAANIAKNSEVPVILDPVGIGASSIRRGIVKELLTNKRVDIIKGNPGEILTLTQKISNTKKTTNIYQLIEQNTYGVDFNSPFKDYLDMPFIIKSIKNLSIRYQVTTVITGCNDLVTDGEQVIILKNGSTLLKKITGSGCMTGSLIASFLAVNCKGIVAAAGGTLIMGVAGQLAEQNSAGPGSFGKLLIDQIYNLDREKIYDIAKIYLLKDTFPEVGQGFFKLMQNCINLM